MEVILLEDIANLGELGEKVNVKAGYGRNFLIPQKTDGISAPRHFSVFNRRTDCRVDARSSDNQRVHQRIFRPGIRVEVC